MTRDEVIAALKEKSVELREVLTGLSEAVDYIEDVCYSLEHHDVDDDAVMELHEVLGKAIFGLDVNFEDDAASLESIRLHVVHCCDMEARGLNDEIKRNAL